MSYAPLSRRLAHLALVVPCALGFSLLTAPAADAAEEYLQGIDNKAQDAMRAGISAALRKLPKCNPFQLLENGECCAPGFVSLGKECARIAPPSCAAVAIDAPESCNITRCAKYTREITKEVLGEDGKPKQVLGDDGKPTGEIEKKIEDVACEGWVNGVRDLTCTLDTYDCKKEELASGPQRWCGDWVNEVPAPPEVDAAGKAVQKAPNIVRCRAGTEGCVLDVRECSGPELMTNRSEGAGPCKIGEYLDQASGRCTGYKCPTQCQMPDGRCAKCGPDYVGAISEFKRATDIDKRFYEAWFNLGMAQERVGRYQDALASYESAKAINPKDDREKMLQLSAQGYIARAWLAQARRYDEAGDATRAKELREKARGLCEAIRGQDPDNTMANVALGLYWLDSGDLKLAEEFVRQALRNNREDTIALNIRGLVNLKQGKNEIARWILEEKVLALDPANPEALANLGLAYVRLGDLPRAVVAFEKAVRLNPNSVPARLNLGAIYLEYLNYRDADRQYNAALKLEPDNLEALTGYALALEGKRDPKKSAELYERVIAKDSTRHAILVRLALIYNKPPFNDGPRAVTYWKRYLEASQLPQETAVKAELDAARAQLKTMEKAPRKAPPDWASKKAALVAKERKLTDSWKNVVAITSRIMEIEEGEKLKSQAKDPETAPKTDPKAEPKPGAAPKADPKAAPTGPAGTPPPS